jgi:hypothetical protein
VKAQNKNQSREHQATKLRKVPEEECTYSDNATKHQCTSLEPRSFCFPRSKQQTHYYQKHHNSDNRLLPPKISQRDLQVWPHFQLIFPSKTWFFFGIYWIFSGRNHLKINVSHILNPNLTKSIPIKSCSSRSFQHHQFLWNFQLGFGLIFSEEIIQYSKTFTL